MIKIAAFLGGLGIILGAFGAHYFKERLVESSLDAYKTGVLYMLLHCVMMLVLALFNSSLGGNKVIKTSFWLILTGMMMFSFSIFLLSTQSLTGINFSWLGPITPIGGLVMIAGWFNLLRY